MKKIFTNIISLTYGALISLFVKPDPKLVYFFSDPDYSDNALALYKYMISNSRYHEYSFVWCSKKKISEIDKLDRTTNITLDKKFKNICVLYKSGYIFYTHNMPEFIKKKENQVIINLWHGCGYKATGYTLENNQMDFRERIRLKRLIFDFMLVPGEIFRETKSKCFRCEKRKVIPLGYPRYDLLNETCNNWNELKNGLGITNEKLVLWMPTYRKNKSGNKNIAILPIVNKQELDKMSDFCRERNVCLVIKAHKNSASFTKSYDTYSNIKYIDDEMLRKYEVQLYQIFQYSTALITDYSSVAVDYLLLNKPIGFTIDDIDEYREVPGFVFDDPLKFMPGHHMVDIDDMKNFIEDIANGKDSYFEVRKSLLPSMHNPCENYCERLLNFLKI